MGFAQGVSGLNASAANLDVIGNNIANSATVGFKTGQAQFADIYAGSRVGLGVQVAAVQQSFSQGAVATSTNQLDTAITNGSGFYRMASSTGEVSYTRNGQFKQDADGYIVNAGGLRLTGYPVDSTGKVSGGQPTAIQIPSAEVSPKATTKYSSVFNLNSTDATPALTPFSAINASTYNYSSSGTIYDSLGNAHSLSNYFVKTAPNTWNVYSTLDGNATSGGGAATGTLVFDSNGQMVTDPAATPTSTGGGVLTIPTYDFGNGSVPLSFNVDLNSTTQFGSASDVKSLSQDGYTSGKLTSYSISADGTIAGTYSNSTTQVLGQVVLASFANPNGLKSVGNNVWQETRDSGQPLIASPGAGTAVGSLSAGATEASNVDLTSELVNLIVAQRTYQANAQTVKTQDQILQTLVSLR